MKIGQVFIDEARAAIRVRGETRTDLKLDAVLDTGFTEWLSLPRATVEQLGLAFFEEAGFALADGSRVSVRTFKAEAFWLGRWRKIFVAEMDGGPLIGMALLRGSRLTMDIIDGGNVQVRRLQRPK